MAISIINIARNSLKLSSINVLSALIRLPVTIYVATILLPEEYGIYGLLSLWLMYASLIGPGIASAGAREMPLLLGRNQERDAVTVQNISLSGELLYAIIPTIIITGASFFFQETVIRIGLIIVAITYATTVLASMWSLMNFTREKFNVVAIGNLILAIVVPVIMLASVNWIRIYALLVGPVVANIIAWVYYLRKGAINFHFKFDRHEISRLLRIGIVLQAITFIGWAYRMADRTIIASMLPIEQLGFYTFAMVFLMSALTLTTDFGNVLQPILWRESGKAGSAREGFRDARRIAVYLALGAGVLIPIAQLGFNLVVKLITTNYIDSIRIFYVLSYNLYLVAIAIIPNLILGSHIVNRQKIIFFLYAMALTLNILFDLLVVRLGYGVVGVAWVTIGTQGIISIIAYYVAKDYISRNMKEFLSFLPKVILPLLVTITFYFIHNYLGVTVPKLGVFTLLSLGIQLVIWGLIILIFYRDYLSPREIRAIRGEIAATLSARRNKLTKK